MNILIMSDIFGVSVHLEELKQAFSDAGNSCRIIDPYDGKPQSFCDEESAYGAFISACGHERYSEHVGDAINASKGQVCVLGFSAGASAAWKALNQLLSPDRVEQLIGFYPSQIRNQLDLTPSSKCLFIFPSAEPHFDLDEVIAVLSKKPKVKCIKTDLKHGFMNPSSKSYALNEAEVFKRLLTRYAKSLNISEFIDNLACLEDGSPFGVFQGR